MPSDLAYWLVSSPTIDNDSSRTLSDVQPVLLPLVASTTTGKAGLGALDIPPLKAGTLSALLKLSDSLPKQDTIFTSFISKTLDTLRSLLNDDKEKMELHTKIDGVSVEEYLFANGGWKWDGSRWGKEAKVADVIEGLIKEMAQIDTLQKSKLQSYNLAKGSLTQMQRKLTGNLATRSLNEFVSQSDFSTGESEFMDTILVAVPNNLLKDWFSRYETLSTFVVPRSSEKIASDDEFTLVKVVVFKKVKDDFSQKCRENKFTVRDFTYDPSQIQKQKEDFEAAKIEERELWADLLRLTRLSFSESFKLLLHLKVAKLFIESVLRYGLPAEYSAIIVKPDVKKPLPLLKSLQSHYSYLSKSSSALPPKRDGAKSKDATKEDTEVSGEYATILEGEIEVFCWEEVGMVV